MYKSLAMKKLILFISVIGALKGHCQETTVKKDSVKAKKNEIGFNILPVFNILSGAAPMRNSEWSLNYRRYLSEKGALRVSIGFFPHQNWYGYPLNGVVDLYASPDTFLVYRITEFKNSPKLQLNVGYERIFRKRIFIHSFGAEVLFCYQHTEIRDEYFWTTESEDIHDFNTFNDLRKHPVDTIGFKSSCDYMGGGMNLFYNLRLPLKKNWLISFTAGPSFALMMGREKRTEVKNKTTTYATNLDFDISSGLISDLSICYRF
jgi:hypothetical protein